MSSPFVAHIQEETIPKKFLMPTMGAYNDTGNLRDHIINYKTFMELQTHFDALLYKVFPTTLIGIALIWFNNLEAESIQTFYDLAKSFMGRFIANVLTQRKISHLETIRQRKDETCENIWLVLM